MMRVIRRVQARVHDWGMKIPLAPRHPDRICWGCDKYCPADDLACGNGTVRTQHPVELFGEDWIEWSERKTAGGRQGDERSA